MSSLSYTHTAAPMLSVSSGTVTPLFPSTTTTQAQPLTHHSLHIYTHAHTVTTHTTHTRLQHTYTLLDLLLRLFCLCLCSFWQTTTASEHTANCGTTPVRHSFIKFLNTIMFVSSSFIHSYQQSDHSNT